MSRDKAEEKKQNRTIRVDKKHGNFVMADKGFIEDERLSYKAKGILVYLLSKPDHWKVIVNDLANHSSDGSSAIYSGLQELQKYGYYKKVPVRDEKGHHIKYWENVIYERPSQPLLCENTEIENASPSQPLLCENTEIENASPSQPLLRENKEIEILGAKQGSDSCRAYVENVDADFVEVEIGERNNNHSQSRINLFNYDSNDNPSIESKSSESKSISISESVSGEKNEPAKSTQEEKPELYDPGLVPTNGIGSDTQQNPEDVASDMVSVDNANKNHVMQQNSENVMSACAEDATPTDNVIMRHAKQQNHKSVDGVFPETNDGQGNTQEHISEYTTYLAIIQENINYTQLVYTRQGDIKMINELLNCILDVICTKGTTVRIGKENKNREMVIRQYLQLNQIDIEHVIDRFKQQRHKITHVHNYLKTMLYTVRQESDHYYTNAVRLSSVVKPNDIM